MARKRLGRMMNPGRELDALIAEKVMGLVNCTHHLGSYCHANPDSPDKGGETRTYSTDISAAWEVVEKLNSIGLEIAIRVGKENTYIPGLRYRVYAHKYPITELVTGEDGLSDSSVPHAICLAALKAVEDKVPR